VIHKSLCTHTRHRWRTFLVCAQGLLNRNPFPTAFVLTGAQRLLNHPVLYKIHTVQFYSEQSFTIFVDRLVQDSVLTAVVM
jgi:hypothetical protein